MRNSAFILILITIVLSFMGCNHSKPKHKGDLIELKSLDKSPITKVDSIFLMDSCKLLICNKDTVQLLNLRSQARMYVVPMEDSLYEPIAESWLNNILTSTQLRDSNCRISCDTSFKSRFRFTASLKFKIDTNCFIGYDSLQIYVGRLEKVHADRFKAGLKVINMDFFSKCILENNCKPDNDNGLLFMGVSENGKLKYNVYLVVYEQS